EGGAGNDRLNGGQGNDLMIGGAGNDIYWVDHASDAVVELAGEGIDQVRTTLTSYTLGANVEGLWYYASDAFTGTGNALNNAILGSIGNDTLNGLAGNDKLEGGAGDDLLNGGLGNDVLVGGLGNDTFIFAAGFGNDRITDFDANPANGQDLLNIAALGVTAANFAANVTIADVGADTLVSVGGDSIRLVGIADATTINQTDFVLAV
ncbi:MAG: calcium-binding protein, partial [Oceanisphaera sp.]|nr:calcium-binding protein [Oceanisphaera sp.]